MDRDTEKEVGMAERKNVRRGQIIDYTNLL